MMFALTILRAVSLLGSSVCLLIAVIVAWPTEGLMDGGWFLLSVLCVAVYVGSTWGFLVASNRLVRSARQAAGVDRA